jgi:hypothetical protein
VQFHNTYLQKRQPGMSYRDFQRLWRSHGDYAASVPAFWDNVERYIQNDPVEGPAGIPGVSTEFDAVGEIYYTSYETWVSMRDVMWNEIKPDEQRVFAGPPTAVRGDRTIFQQPEGLYKLFTFASFKDEEARLNPAETLAEHAAMTMALPGFGSQLAGFTATTARQAPPDSGMSSVAQTSSNRDVLFIHHFPSEEAARGALLSADYLRLQAAEEQLFDWDSRIVILSRGWIFKGDND